MHFGKTTPAAVSYKGIKVWPTMNEWKGEGRGAAPPPILRDCFNGGHAKRGYILILLNVTIDNKKYHPFNLDCKSDRAKDFINI